MILKNTSARCVCPKSCDVTRYKVSTSYASVNQNIDSKFSLSSEFQTRLGKKLNKSLDTREWIVKDRRQANIDDTEKLLDGLYYMGYPTRDRDEDTIVKRIMSGIMGDITRVYHLIVEVMFPKMEDVFKNGFMAAWYEINFHECMSGLYELSLIIAHTLENIQQKTWRAVIGVLLEKKLLASERTMLDLDRVHSAFWNAVPLLNYTATPDGRFDSFYLTRALLKQSSEINETYCRLRGQLMENMQNINTLLNLTSLEVPNGETGYIDCTAEIKAVTDAYIADQRLYETLVIKHPQERLLRAKGTFLDYKERISIFDVSFRHLLALGIHQARTTIFDIFDIFFEIEANSETEKYLQYLKQNRPVSKLRIVNMFKSENISKTLPELAAGLIILSQTQINFQHFERGLDAMYCRLLKDAVAEPILQEMIVKWNDSYIRANPSKQDFMYAHYVLLTANLLSHTKCKLRKSFTYNHIIMTLSIWLDKLTPFRTKQERFLEETRLDGTFFR